MTCSHGIFKGDDLIDVIQINRPSNTDDLTITQAILMIGPLRFEKNNPVFPYYVSIMREDSAQLDYDNPVYLGIVYTDTQGHTNVRQTCIGNLTLNANAQEINWQEQTNE